MAGSRSSRSTNGRWPCAGEPARPGPGAWPDGPRRLRGRAEGHRRRLLHGRAQGRPALDGRTRDARGLASSRLERIAVVPQGKDDSSHHGQFESARTGRPWSPPGVEQGAALWARFTPHYTPKHGSWLNPAEMEASLWSRECHGHHRVDKFEALRDRTHAWTSRAARARRTILAIHDRQGAAVFRYKRRSTVSRSRH